MTRLVTNEFFHDFLKCKYKAFLDLTFETIKPSEFEKIQKTITSEYKLRTLEHISHNSSEIYLPEEEINIDSPLIHKASIVTNIFFKNRSLKVNIDAIKKNASPKEVKNRRYIPVLFFPDERQGETVPRRLDGS
jgi:hypothetical protein